MRGTRERDTESDGARFGSVVNLNVRDTGLDRDHFIDGSVVLDSEVRSAGEDDTSDTLSCVNLNCALAASGDGPGRVPVLLILLLARLESWALHFLGLAIGQ